MTKPLVGFFPVFQNLREAFCAINRLVEGAEKGKIKVRGMETKEMIPLAYIVRFPTDDINDLVVKEATNYWDEHKEDIETIIKLLKTFPNTRRAVLPIFEHYHIGGALFGKRVPCIISVQFIIRDKSLLMIAHSRSSDVANILASDLMLFQRLHQRVAKAINVTVGSLIHFINSAHIYLEPGKTGKD